MSSPSPEQVLALLPLASAWAAEQESRILAQGDALSDAQLADARAIGVASPEAVRWLAVAQIPVPENPVLAMAAQTAGLVFSTASGLTLRYGIYLRADRASDRQLLAHELVHVRQCERFGGIEPFLRQYLTECLNVGYAQSPLEQEAISIAARVCAG